MSSRVVIAWEIFLYFLDLWHNYWSDSFTIFKRIYIFSGDDKINYYQESFDQYEQQLNCYRNT